MATKSTFDDALVENVGQFGRYQIVRVLLISTINIIGCFTSMSAVFIADKPEHHCQVPQELLRLNCTEKQLQMYSIPTDQELGAKKLDACHLLKRNYANVTEEEVCPENGLLNGTTATKVSCDSWDYDTSIYDSTVVSEWDLVCDRAWLAKNTAGLYMAARMFGTLVGGWLTDRFGRKRIMIVAGFIDGASFFLSGLMPNYELFIVCKVIQGSVSLLFFSAGYVLAMEITGPKYREVTAGVMQLTWAVGYFILPLIAYLFSNWRHLVYVLGSTHFFVWILLLVFEQESPRWLLVKGKHKEMNKIFQRMVKENGRKLSNAAEVASTIQEDTSDGSSTPLDLVRTRALRLVSANLCWAWFVVSYVYYGIAMNISDLGGNIFVNFVISAAAEFPAYFLSTVIAHFCGRVVPLSATFFLSGLCLLLVAAVPAHLSWPVILLAMLGKFFNCIAFSLVYLVASEVYSTNIRGLGLCFNSTMARIGATVGVYAGLLISVHRALPPIVFAIPSIIAGSLVLALPETKGEQLTQTLDECEEFAARKSCGFCKGRRKDSVAQFDPEEAIRLSNHDETTA